MFHSVPKLDLSAVRSAARLPAALVALSLLTAACDSDDPGPSVPGLSVSLYRPSGAADPFEGVGWIRMVLSGDGLATPFVQTVKYTPGGSANLQGVPFSAPGQKRRLTVEGLTDSGGLPGFVLSRGRAPAVAVEAGAKVQSLDVLFSRVNSFAQLTSTTTKQGQRLTTGRVGHAATMTPDAVVVSGGGAFQAGTAQWWTGSGFQTVHSSVESLDLKTREVTTRTPMLMPRTWHTGIGLSSGQVLLAGGYDASGQPTATVELHNPPGVLEGRAMGLPPLATPRAGHTATLIDENTRLILFVGGDEVGTWELWDPNFGSRGLRVLPDERTRRHHQATTFYVPGRTEPAVLISGGETATGALNNVLLYDSVAEKLMGLPQEMPAGARTQHSAVYVPERNFIYVAGGFDDISRQSMIAAIDVFDISQTRFLEGQSGFRMRTARGGHAATLLSDNLVFISGGVGQEPPGSGVRPLSSLEVIYEYIDAGSHTLQIQVASSWDPSNLAQVPYMPIERVGHRVVNLDGMALLIGGAAYEPLTSTFKTVPELWLYNPQ